MCPADVLMPNWSLSRPAAFDLRMLHPLNSAKLLEVSLISGPTAERGKKKKNIERMMMPVMLGDGLASL